MRITAVTGILLSAPYAAPGDAERELHHQTGFRPTCLIKVATDEGLYGLGETNAGVFAPEATLEHVRQFESELLGRDPLETLALWDRLRLATYYWGRFGITQSAMGGIELALWDLKGKALDRPVCDLLGGKMQEEIEVYASGGNPKPLEDIEREMESYREAGYRTVKIRICHMTPQRIRATVARCRSTLGPGISLAVDAVQGIARKPWDLKQALEIARSIEPFNIRWLEEPMEVTNYAGLAELRQRTGIPIAGGESVTSMAEVDAYLESGAVDLFQVDASVVGGLGVFRRVAALCERRAVPLAVHAWGSAPGIMANYHAAFTTRNCAILEWPAVPHALGGALLTEPLRVREGHLAAPTAPGLGVHLPPGLEEQYPYRPGSVYRILAPERVWE